MTVKQRGRPSFRPPTKTVGVTISVELSNALEEFAQELGVSKRAVIESGLKRQLAQRPDPRDHQALVLPRKTGPKHTICALIDIELLKVLDEYIVTYGLAKHDVYETAVSRELGIDPKELEADRGSQMQLAFKAS